MRRSLLALLALLAMAVGGTITTVVVGGSRAVVVSSISDPLTIESSLPGKTGAVDLPYLAALDLPPFDGDLSKYRKNDPNEGGVGVPWVAQAGIDPTSLLTTDAQREIYTQIDACFPRQGDERDGYLGKNGCFDPTVVSLAATLRNPLDLFTAIDTLSQARPELFTLCHNASHSVGEIVMRRVFAAHGLTVETLAALLDRGGAACMGGLVHGLLDAVGFLVEDVHELRPAAEACLQINPDNTGYCTDAVGHATWDAFESLERSPIACAFFPLDYQRRECGEGILMRMYQRIEEEHDRWYGGRLLSTDEDLAEWNRRLVDVCAQWLDEPVDAVAENPQEWCWTGSAYLFAKPVFAAIQDLDNDYVAARPAVEYRLRSAVHGCRSFGDEGSELCLRRLSSSVGHLAGFDLDVATELCRTYPPSLFEDCVTGARGRIDSVLD